MVDATQNPRSKNVSLRSIVFFLLIGFTSFSAHSSGYDVQRFQSFMKLSDAEKERDISYLIGVSRGLILSSMYSNQANGSPLFCVPSGSFQEAYGGSISLLESEIASPSKGEAYAPETPIEMVMLRAFIVEYRCSE